MSPFLADFVAKIGDQKSGGYAISLEPPEAAALTP